MKNRVVVILFVYKNLVFGKSLYVRSDLIGRFKCQLYYKGHSFSIVSSYFPAMQSQRLYLQGTCKDSNNCVFFRGYSNKEQALLHFNGLQEGIHLINNMTEDNLLACIQKEWYE